jgi:hypothetical protein
MREVESGGWQSGNIGAQLLVHRGQEGYTDDIPSMILLRELHAKYLISSRLFVGWLVDTLSSTNLAQIGFIASLFGDYLPEMARHVVIARQCVRVVLAKIDEVS